MVIGSTFRNHHSCPYRLGVLCFLMFLNINVLQSVPLFRNFDMQSGLSQYSVLTITQDSVGFMWFGTKDGLNRFDGQSFKVYRQGDGSHGLGSDYINALYLDPFNVLWVGTDKGVFLYSSQTDSFSPFDMVADSGEKIVNNINLIHGHGDDIYINSQLQGLFRYNVKRKTLEHFPLAGLPNVTSLAVGGDGRIWLGFFGGGLCYTDNTFQTINTFYDNHGNNTFLDHTIFGIIPTEQGQLFVCDNLSGLYEVGTKTHVITNVMPDQARSVFAHSILRSGNEIWMATEDGLYIYELLTHEMHHYTNEPSNLYSLSDNSLHSLFCDRYGGVWIGTYFGGVSYSPSRSYVIDKFFPRLDRPNTLSGRRVREFAEDTEGNIWVGTEDHGLNCYNPKTDQFRYIAASNSFPNIHGLAVIGRELWVGTFSYGLKILDIPTGRIVRSYSGVGPNALLPDNNVFTICAVDDKVYLGQLSGLTVYDPSTDTFTPDTVVTGKIVYDIHQDHQKTLWVALYGNGLYRRAAGETTWHRYSSHDEARHTPSDNILSIFEDSNGTIWITTEGQGVARYDMASDSFVSVPIPSYHPVRTVFRIVEDSRGLLWMSSGRGLLRYNPKSNDARIYTTSNGLLDNSFNYSSSLHTSDDRIYMGCLSGFIAFSPGSFIDTDTRPVLVATQLLINNTEVDNYTTDSPLEQSITTTRRLTLRHDQNSFSLRIAQLNFNEQTALPIEYMLEGFDNDWQQLHGEKYITYTNLPSGTRLLKVRTQGSNGPQESSLYELTVVVKPAPWASWWARLLYAAALGLLAWAVYRYVSHRSSMRRHMLLEKIEHEKDQELYQSKINFFTNVAHEIRTPLSLIKGPLSDILSHRKPSADEEYESLCIMGKNVDRLLDLTNQLLDFRSTERDGLRLNFEQCNIGALVESVYVRFKPTIRQQSIESELILPAEPLMAYVDREAFTKIVSNLINNAVKYCDRLVKVSVGIINDYFFVESVNDGPLVEYSLREQLFKPFFRAGDVSQTGTGIGLALARSLTELHGGTLEMVDSEQYNIFRLQLPIEQKDVIRLDEDHALPFEEERMASADNDGVNEDGERATVLIVEDNRQMLQYERRVIGRTYHVLTAENGEQALQLLPNNDIDIIVSDVMMEPIGGIELCRMVKQDLNYSHIPFILLTAVTLETSKVEAMESGADSYIEKPFSVEYLFSVIQNLLRQRENMRSAYVNSPFVQGNTLTISQADSDFVERLQRVVSEHLSDKDFDITLLASEMCMSRTSLNRKMRGVFNLTPNNYIKVERLKRAAQLLKMGDSKVSEVCYIVGFNSPSYFSQCFYKQFGLLPKDFVSEA